jgi:predicted DNA-binding protein
MVVHLKPETESRLRELSATTGRAPEDLVEDAMSGYLEELTQTRKVLDSRYDEIKSGQVKPIDGEEALNRMRHKSQERRRAERLCSPSGSPPAAMNSQISLRSTLCLAVVGQNLARVVCRSKRNYVTTPMLHGHFAHGRH